MPIAAPMPAMALAMPHGSVAAAAVVSAAFLLLALPVAYSLRATRFKTYILMLASLLFRGAGYALHAAAIARHDPALEAAFQALRAAGFGMAVGVVILIFFSWFKNSARWARPFGAAAAARASNLARALIPLVIMAGPILGAAAAGLIYSAPPTPAKAAAAAGVRAASASVLLAAAGAGALLGLFAAASCWLGARRCAARGGFGGGGGVSGSGGGGIEAGGGGSGGVEAGGAFVSAAEQEAHAWVALPLAAALVLVVAAAQRVASLRDPSYLTSDARAYVMGALPEILNAALLAWPLLLARVAMCGALWRHMEAAFGGGGRRAGAPAAAASAAAVDAAAGNGYLGEGKGAGAAAPVTEVVV